jgi:peptidoglycan/LPS O-acetylase OafA/YrhL
LFVFVVRRLIGVRVPVLRTLAAGIVAVLVFSPIVTAMIGGPGFPRKGSALPALWFVILGAVIALLAPGLPGHRRGAGAQRVGAPGRSTCCAPREGG